MAATVILVETNGSAPVEFNNPANINFGSNDSPEIVPASFPVTAQADGHSFEKWLRFKVTAMGGSSQIDVLKVWKSAGAFLAEEGISVSNTTTGYTAPTYPTGTGPIQTNSASAVNPIPTSEPGGANTGIGGSLSGQITSAPTFSDYFVLQMDVGATTPPGNVNQKTLKFQYDEQ